MIPPESNEREWWEPKRPGKTPIAQFHRRMCLRSRSIPEAAGAGNVLPGSGGALTLAKPGKQRGDRRRRRRFGHDFFLVVGHQIGLNAAGQLPRTGRQIGPPSIPGT